MRTAILTISSSLARGEGDDLSAPALADDVRLIGRRGGRSDGEH